MEPEAEVSGGATVVVQGPSRRMLRRIQHKAEMKLKKKTDRVVKHCGLQATAVEVSATSRCLASPRHARPAARAFGACAAHWLAPLSVCARTHARASDRRRK